MNYHVYILMYALVLLSVAGGFIANGMKHRRKWKASGDAIAKEEMLADFSFAAIAVLFFVFAGLGEYQKAGAN